MSTAKNRAGLLYGAYGRLDRVNHGCLEVTDAANTFAHRAERVAGAWREVLEHRREVNGGHERAPHGWEWENPADAVALALEAAGCTPSAVDQYGKAVRSGYRVVDAGRDGCARINYQVWHRLTAVGDPERLEQGELHRAEDDALRAYQVALEERGWQCSVHGGLVTLRRFILASPRLI